jgi:hypothetical protein
MLALMLDFLFKHLHHVENYVGHRNIVHLAIEYDVKEIIPLFMTCFHQLTPTIDECRVPDLINLKTTLTYLVLEPLWRSLHEHLLLERYLFKRLLILLITCEDPLARWHINERKFSDVAFLAKQILGIPRSQFKQSKCLVLLQCRHLCNTYTTFATKEP